MNQTKEKKIGTESKNVAFFIMTKTNSKQTEKVKQTLDKEGIDYQVWDNKKVGFIDKIVSLSPKQKKMFQKTQKVIDAIRKVKIKY